MKPQVLLSSSSQTFCVDVMRTDFIVWFCDQEPFFVKTIFYDEKFISKYVLLQLKLFYCPAVLPEFFTGVKWSFVIYARWLRDIEKEKAK